MTLEPKPTDMKRGSVEECRQTLISWLDEFKNKRSDWHRYFTVYPDRLKLSLWTDNYHYIVTACPVTPINEECNKGNPNGYLGCQVNNRKPLPGEDWFRGSDLSDGDFAHKTWVKILGDIVGYELVSKVKTRTEEEVGPPREEETAIPAKTLYRKLKDGPNQSPKKSLMDLQPRNHGVETPKLDEYPAVDFSEESETIRMGKLRQAQKDFSRALEINIQQAKAMRLLMESRVFGDSSEILYEEYSRLSIKPPRRSGKTTAILNNLKHFDKPLVVLYDRACVDLFEEEAKHLNISLEGVVVATLHQQPHKYIGTLYDGVFIDDFSRWDDERYTLWKNTIFYPCSIGSGFLTIEIG